MRVLKLYDGTHEKAWKILDDYSLLYGDNGGCPNGNCWLPNASEYALEPIPDELVESVKMQGYGEMVHVMLANDDAMLTYFGLFHHPNYEYERKANLDIVQGLANDQLQWAHYGVYNTGDSHWVFVKPEEEA